jgi:hypothetical protein
MRSFKIDANMAMISINWRQWLEELVLISSRMQFCFWSFGELFATW